MIQNYIIPPTSNHYQNIIPTSNPTYEIYGTSNYQNISGQNVITLPAISYQELQKQDNYLNTNQNVVYNIPQSNVGHGNQNLGAEIYQQKYSLYTAQPQAKIVQPQPNKIQQIKVPRQNNYQQTQPQPIQYQQKTLQQNPQALPRAKVQPIIQQNVPKQQINAQQLPQLQIPAQQVKAPEIIQPQPKANVQGQPTHQQNIIQNKVPQIDVDLQNIQDKPFFMPNFEPNLKLANLILSEPQIPVEIITTQPPEKQTSGEKAQAHSEVNPNAQKVKQQNNQKIMKPIRNPNTNIKQYEQSTDTHFVNTNEAAKTKTNAGQLQGYGDTVLDENDRPTVGEGHGLFGSMAVVENFDDNIQEANKIKLKGGNAGNNNVKSITTNEAKNILNNQATKNIPGKESLNTQKPIENNNINSINGNNASLPQNQRTESVTENLDQLPTIGHILQGKKEVLPPPITKKYKN